ncbi:MAG TPA: hypothetical protein GX729_07095 [Firmicutes bacterium]|nr:hypothetical protein [Bacillota bacterium]
MKVFKSTIIRKMSLFLLCSIFLLSFNSITYASDMSVRDTRITLDDIIDELTGEDLANVYLEIKNEKDFNQLTLDQKNEYVIEKIIQNYLNPNKIVPMGLRLSKYLPESYNDLNDEEKRLVKRYPLEAITYYYASKEAFSETDKVFGGNYTDDASDAFRHTYWNAILVNYFYVDQIEGNGSRPSMKYAVTATERWTTAHEYDSYGLPKRMDLSNNKLGRDIGARYAPSKLSVISNAVYRAIRNGEAVMIENNRLVPTRI